MLTLGLMSGTSLDGIDAALVTTDGESVQDFGQAATYPYAPAFRARLRSVLGGQGPVAEVEEELTHAHADAVLALLDKASLTPGDVDLIGFHGHTILHRPDEGRTWQIGDGALLARLTGIAVVNDFRSADVAAGGQGAPLVPVLHRALAKSLPRPLAILNLGGVGNVTWLGEGDAMLAFDTGPGNALIDDWALARTGQPVDMDGALARQGRVDRQAVTRFAAHPFFSRRPPKSLDRDDFAAFAASLVAGLNDTDGAATLTSMTVTAAALAKGWFPQPATRWLVCGGGRHNPAIMAALAHELAVPVEPVENVGWNGDALEAQAFGLLAARSSLRRPITFPETTGARISSIGGVFHPRIG